MNKFMKSNMKTNQRGFIQLIIIIVIVLLILGYYGFDLKKFIDSPGVQNTWNYIWNAIKFVWDKLTGAISWILAKSNISWSDIKNVAPTGVTN